MRRICTAAMHVMRYQHFWLVMVVLAEFAAGFVVMLVIDPMFPPEPLFWEFGDPIILDPVACTCIVATAEFVMAGTWLCLHLVHTNPDIDKEFHVEWTLLVLLLGPIGHVLYLARIPLGPIHS